MASGPARVAKSDHHVHETPKRYDLHRFLRDLWTQVSDLRSEGLSEEEAVTRVDLSTHEVAYGARARRVDPRAVVRIYKVLQIQHPLQDWSPRGSIATKPD